MAMDVDSSERVHLDCLIRKIHTST